MHFYDSPPRPPPTTCASMLRLILVNCFRKLIINEGLDFGSQLPYIQRVQDLNFGVLVHNPNEMKNEQGISNPGKEQRV